jgi:hypothetical protein
MNRLWGKTMRRVPLTGLAVLLGLAANAVSGQHASTASLLVAARQGPAPTEKPVKQPPIPSMVFFVAKGEPHACGRDCAEWIGADGTLDSGAPQRLRALLNRLGRRKLPIYFHSPGGSVAAALAIGRLMRQRGVTAGVGWTVPQGCNPDPSREPACDKLKRSGRELPAQLDTSRTMCNSACVYALVGAAVRDIGPGASLGIHSSAITFVNSQTHAPTRAAPHVVRAALIAGYERIGSYLREMGIDPALLRAAREIENDRVRFLTRAEIWRFNIDRRSVVESDWKLVEQPVRAIRKVFVSDFKGGHTDYRTALIRLTCSTPDRLSILVAREISPGDAPAIGLRLSGGGMTHELKAAGHTTLPVSKIDYDLSTAYVPLSFLSGAGDVIALSSFDAPANAPTTDSAVELSTAGLAPAVAKLMPLCGAVPAAVKAHTSIPAGP